MNVAIGPLARRTRAKCNGAVFFDRRRVREAHTHTEGLGDDGPAVATAV